MFRKSVRKNRGQALVEFALILPILILLLSGIIEFGRIFGAELLVTHSAREGARMGAVGATDTEITEKVLNSAVALNDALLTVVISPEEEDRVRGGEISVEVSYPVTIVTPFITVFTGETVTVDATCVMRVE